MPLNEPIVIPQPGPIPTAAAWGLPNQFSSWANIQASSFEPQAPTSSSDTTGCFYDIPNLVTLLAGASYQIPYGSGQIITGASVNSAVVQVNQAGVWTTIRNLNANDSWYYESDYTNMRILNGASGTTVLTLMPKRKR